jgi:2-amino-4-hydroxy-6-hydroxymethyldihydropteridine diphosphokinase
VENRVFLSLGSNVGDRGANLREALDRLRKVFKVRAVSSIYETAPVEFTLQPDFYNLVVSIETEKTAEEVLQEILRVEQAMGRVRLQDKGPRTIDIDILLFGDQVIDSEHLTVPHPAMHERLFVLAPLAEIAPEVKHPILHKKARELVEAFEGNQEVRRLAEDV